METNIAEDLKNYEPKLKPYPMKVPALNKVLIVEDDVSLSTLLTRVLEDLAPNVEIDWATSGEEAEAYLRKEGKVFGKKPYDLVIADIFLEGEVTGLDIWKLCDNEYPETNILVTSSLPVERFVSCLKNEFACPPYLPKPFTMAECIEAINEFM